jgi:hypothetical protein
VKSLPAFLYASNRSRIFQPSRYFVLLPETREMCELLKAVIL